MRKIATRAIYNSLEDYMKFHERDVVGDYDPAEPVQGNPVLEVQPLLIEIWAVGMLFL